MPSEYIGQHFQDQLLEVGATDFFFTSIQMKKGRPGLNLTVLAKEDRLEAVQDYLLEHTSSIGLRFTQMDRVELDRRSLEVETSFGSVKVKEVIRPSGKRSWKIEYESLRKISKEHKQNMSTIEHLIRQEIASQLS